MKNDEEVKIKTLMVTDNLDSDAEKEELDGVACNRNAETAVR